MTKPTVTLWKHYVATPTGMGAVYVRRSDGTSDTYYLTTDHLGSTDRILKAATGTVQVAESFDSFGKRRGSDWQGAPSAADLTAISNSTPDGFTGHEMLDGVGLIHMNGRVYDPTVGRFLSVDPIVHDSAASQSWNGYGYVEGRTLSATDPTGWTTTEHITVTGRRILPRQDQMTISMDVALNASWGRSMACDVPRTPESYLEEVVVDGQRSQPPGVVVTLTFMPVSISPPNHSRISRILNAAEADYASCMTKCRSSTGHVTQTLAGVAGGAVTGYVASKSVPG